MCRLVPLVKGHIPCLHDPLRRGCVVSHPYGFIDAGLNEFADNTPILIVSQPSPFCTP